MAQSSKAASCTQCGAHAVHPLVCSGRTTRYRNMTALAIPDDFSIPTCGRCRREEIDTETRAALMKVLAEEYKKALKRRVRRAINKLTPHITQRRLEILLGLSSGYLSRLRSGAGNPSPELVSNLALIAKDPQVRLLELERYWTEPISEDPSSYEVSALAG